MRIYKQLFSVILLSLFFQLPLQASTKMEIYDLLCENLVNPLAIDNLNPHFSWKTKSTRKGSNQSAYEIQVGTDSVQLSKGNADLWRSGKVKSHQSVMVNYKGQTLIDKMLCWWRVRVWDNKGKVSPWSSVSHFGIGIVSSRMQGYYIGLDSSAYDARSPILWKTINLNKVSKSIIHVNSLGYHELYVNGRKVGNHVLVPSVSQLDKRSLIVSYDITSYLSPGKNDIVLWIGQGWYKPTTFHATYKGALVKAEIDMYSGGKWNVIAITDNSWKGRPSGYGDTGTWTALHFGGESVDGSLLPTDMSAATLESLPWSQAKVVDIRGIKATPQMSRKNSIVKVLSPKSVSQLNDSTWLVDMGRDLTGWFSLRLHNIPKGSVIGFEYADQLNKKGQFDSTGESDSYKTAGRSDELFCNKFMHHAFRYIRISNLKQRPLSSDISAMQITDVSAPTASFACSDNDINKIHDMIHYTMQCLTFSGYMVDCPHLERTGYGGDGNSSTMTLQTTYDVAPTYYNWLQAWGDVIEKDGSLPYVAPAGGGGGGPYWSAFIVKAPWRTYLNYGDRRLLESCYNNMRLWMSYVEKFTSNGLFTKWGDTSTRMWFLGDWLAPAGIDVGAGESVSIVANCVKSECLSIMERTARLLGKDDDAEDYRQRRDKLNNLIHATFYHPADSTYATASPLDMAYPMLVGAVPDNLKAAVNKKLTALCYGKYKAHIACGLVGVPIFTEWATQNDASQLMYTILKQTDYPGYLNMIRNNATTTWESWDGSRSRIHNCYNGIGTWFYQALGGIIPDADDTGYHHVFINPQTPDGIKWTKVSKETPYGTLSMEWTKEDNMVLDIEVPFNSSATVLIPSWAHDASIDGKSAGKKNNSIEIGSGKHHVVFMKNSED